MAVDDGRPRITGVMRFLLRGPCLVSSGPSLDVLTKPKTNAALAQINNRTREVRVATQIGRHAVVMREPQDHSSFRCADEVLRVNPRIHDASLRKLTSQVEEARLLT
jgi:hypothetical protein